MDNNNIINLKLQNYNTPYFNLNGMYTICKVVDVIDGDTIVVVIYLFNNYYKFVIRIDGIDTCETKSKNIDIHSNGIKAKNAVIHLLLKKNLQEEFIFSDTNELSKKEVIGIFEKNCILIWIKCKNFDKFGRTLADVFLDQEQTQSVSTILLHNKLAYPYHGEKKLTEEEISKYLDLN